MCSAEVNLLTTNSGVTSETMQLSSIVDAHTVIGPVTYYGKVQEILELDYGRLKPVLLFCNWVAPISRGPTICQKVDKYGFTLVKLSRLMRRSTNSFIFPVHASKIIFSHFLKDLKSSTMIHTESRSACVYEDTNLVCSVLCFDTDVQMVDGGNLEDEDDEASEGRGCTELGRQHMTEEDIMASRAAVEWETEQEENKESDANPLVECEVDED